MTATFSETSSLCGTENLELAIAAHEKAALLALAGRLAQVEPGLVDSPDWQQRCRAAGALPDRISALLRSFRHDSGAGGTAFLADLPIEADSIPPTPRTPDSAEPRTTTPAVLSMLLGNELGTVVAYRDEKNGHLVQNVVPVPSLSGSQSNGGSVELELHTENAFHPHRPDCIGLLCLRSTHEDQVGTRIASIRQALPLLESRTREILHEARFVTEAPPSFRTTGASEPRPVLSGTVEDPDICVDFNATTGLDRQAEQALAALRDALEAVRRDVLLRPGDMVFVDNRIVVHGRAPFAPRYDGSDRWLHRIFVHFDHRRSRRNRVGNGVVLT